MKGRQEDCGGEALRHSSSRIPSHLWGGGPAKSEWVEMRPLLRSLDRITAERRVFLCNFLGRLVIGRIVGSLRSFKAIPASYSNPLGWGTYHRRDFSEAARILPPPFWVRAWATGTYSFM